MRSWLAYLCLLLSPAAPPLLILPYFGAWISHAYGPLPHFTVFWPAEFFFSLFWDPLTEVDRKWFAKKKVLCLEKLYTTIAVLNQNPGKVHLIPQQLQPSTIALKNNSNEPYLIVRSSFCNYYYHSNFSFFMQVLYFKVRQILYLNEQPPRSQLF